MYNIEPGIAAQLTVSKSEFSLRPLQCLFEMSSFVLPNTKVRPIATMITEREDWLPTTFMNEKQKVRVHSLLLYSILYTVLA